MVVWTGALKPPRTGYYNIILEVNGEANVFIGGQLIIEHAAIEVFSFFPRLII